MVLSPQSWRALGPQSWMVLSPPSWRVLDLLRQLVTLLHGDHDQELERQGLVDNVDGLDFAIWYFKLQTFDMLIFVMQI